MLKREIKDILLGSADVGWVLEPEAKQLLSLSGIDVPKFEWATNAKEALQFAKKIGYPVVAKIVSPRVLHKTEASIMFIMPIPPTRRDMAAMDPSRIL